MIGVTLLGRFPPCRPSRPGCAFFMTTRGRSESLQSAGKDLGSLGLDDVSQAARGLPPNVAKLLALYRKPVGPWTREDRARAYELVRDWTGEDHKAFAHFIEELL
jgi:hypothetical protein